MGNNKKDKTELVTQNRPRALSPFEEMERHVEDFFRHPFAAFDQPAWPPFKFLKPGETSPSVDIFEDKGVVVVRAEVPGIAKEDLQVNISDNILTISGEKKQETKEEKKNYHRLECSYGSFCRRFRLPQGVEADKAAAAFKDGVLEIRLPRGKDSSKKTIPIA
ncbi:MAG: hypothetical protein BWK76_20865 [Desulfobulbaceae bacterium A2]|nr:MAG: hypothetical protein BWK76_20865 [Desulfobulbaceae bacterium A2]